MPLHYEATKPLTVPGSEFNENHIAVLLVIGNRYGGQWTINLLTQREHPDEATPLGTIETFYDHQSEDLTDSPRYAQLGLDTAVIWLLAEAKRRNWRLLVWESLNDQVPEGARKFTIGARVAFGGEQFVPAPGAKYADEILTGTAKP